MKLLLLDNTINVDGDGGVRLKAFLRNSEEFLDNLKEDYNFSKQDASNANQKATY
jgi:hypothetical protein